MSTRSQNSRSLGSGLLGSESKESEQEPYKPIGAGSYGEVHALRDSATKEPSNKVVKVSEIKTSRAHQAFSKANQSLLSKVVKNMLCFYRERSHVARGIARHTLAFDYYRW